MTDAQLTLNEDIWLRIFEFLENAERLGMFAPQLKHAHTKPESRRSALSDRLETPPHLCQSWSIMAIARTTIFQVDKTEGQPHRPIPVWTVHKFNAD